MSPNKSEEILSLIRSLRTKHIDHREYRNAREALFTHATFAAPGTVIILVGPSRVGKTRIAKAIRKRLAPSESDSPFRVCLWAEAVNPDRGRFSLKHLTLRLLHELDHPIYRETDLREDGKTYTPRRDATEPKLRLAVERAMDARQTKWLFIDEAHHVVTTHTPSHARNYLDSLKSLGNTTGVVSVWVSGYPIFDYGFANPHLNGRIRVIHMRRYTDSSEDMDEFCSTLATLGTELPLDKNWSITEAAWMIRANTSGCIGALISWTEAALAEMVLLKDTSLSLKHFKASRYCLQLEGVEDEICSGEKLLRNVDLFDDSVLHKRQQLAIQRASSANKSPPFQRKPKRVPVGRPE